LPLGGWGLLYYLGMGLLFLAPLMFGKEFQSLSKFLIFLFSLCAVFAGIFFISLMTAQPQLFCPFCTVIHTCNFILFFLFAKINRYSFRAFFKDVKLFFQTASIRKIFSAPGFWKAFSLLIVGFFVLSGFFGLRVMALKAAAAQKVDFSVVFADFDKEPVRQISINPGDAVMGDTSRHMTLTVFSDFYCPACRFFSAETDSIIKKFGKDCAVVFKHFPLSTTCNDALDKDLHPGSCDAAKASLAAAQQGKFFAFHNEMFKDKNKANLTDVARNSGLDLTAFEKFRNSPEAASILQKNILEAKQLNINGTPAVFLNGRQIKDIRKDVVTMVLMRELLKKANDQSKTN
jgi:predicted DsbA family dithiol-disulfide isomerase